MRRAAWLLAALAGCTLDSPALELRVVDDEPLVADDASVVLVEVCNPANEPAASVVITLSASIGRWVRAKSADARTIAATLTDETPCAREPWIAGRRAGPVRFEAVVAERTDAQLDAEIGPVTRLASLALRADPVVLSSEGESTLTLRLDLRSLAGGVGSDGLVVEVDAPVAEPLAAAALSDGPFVLGTRESLTLRTIAGTRAVRVVARFRSAEQTLEACRLFLPLGRTATTTPLRCPL